MKEKQLTRQVCSYIKYQYKDVIFTVDTSGIKLTIGQATQMKLLRSDRGLPDLLIFEPNKKYKGLFIELKREDEKLFNKNDEYRTQHLKEQARIIERLNKKGYYACWGVGFNMAKETIDAYMNNKL